MNCGHPLYARSFESLPDEIAALRRYAQTPLQGDADASLERNIWRGLDSYKFPDGRFDRTDLWLRHPP
jgi:hypothetical protein